jgi:hypothetical protein
MRLHGRRIGARTGAQRQVEARVIIQERQWMAAAGRGFKVPLEVDLPQRIGLSVLEALPGTGRLGIVRGEQMMPSQDVGDGTGRCA